jgi:uncharacterized protein involved in response to NO
MIVALKTIGYLVSIVSVILLGIAAWRAAPQDEILQLCLIGGMIASVIGMLLRWLSHLKDQQEKDKLARNG